VTTPCTGRGEANVTREEPAEYFEPHNEKLHRPLGLDLTGWG